MHMNITKSIKQKLTRKIVLLGIKNQHNQLLLHKHPKTSKHNAGLWDISVYSHVYAHEACEDAALRGLEEQLGLKHTILHEIAQLPFRSHQDIPFLAHIFLTSKLTTEEEIRLLYNARLQNKETMFILPSELKAIVEHSQELFTPELIWAATSWL